MRLYGFPFQLSNCLVKKKIILQKKKNIGLKIYKKKTCKKKVYMTVCKLCPSTFKMSRLACHWKLFASSFFVLSLEGARVSNFEENKSTRSL